MRRVPFWTRPASPAVHAIALAALHAAVAYSAPAAPLAEDGSRHVRAIETRRTGIESVSGVAYSRRHALFYLLEAPGSGGRARRIVTLNALDERIGIAELPFASSSLHLAFDDRHGRLLLYDDVEDRLLALGLGPDGAVDAASARRLATPRVGPLRLSGLACDPANGAVLLLDRLSRRILRFTPEATDPDAKEPGEPAWIPLGPLGRLDLRGVAFDPVDAHLYLLDANALVLHRLTQAGESAGSYDLRASGVAAPRGFVFAPTGDRTDDPLAHDLFVAAASTNIRARASLVEVALGAGARAGRTLEVEAVAGTASLVRVIDTSIWSTPSPDPSGMAYDPTSGRLVMVDGEVEETGRWRNVNFYELTLAGAYVRGANLTSYSIEPVGVTYNTLNGHFLISDDDARRVFDVDPGPDRVVGTPDDRMTSFSTTAFDSGDPEGITFDRIGNRLFIADGVNSEIYVVAPGPNGLFDGVGDVVTHFDIGTYGASDPECVEFHPARGTLFTMGSSEPEMIEITTAGALVGTFDVSFLDSDHAAGMAFAPGSSNPGATHLYISDRKVDNDSQSSENDGLIYEITFDASPPDPPGQPGTAWRVAAGSDDAEESASGSVSVTGSDLELVEDGNLQVVGLRFGSVAIPPGARVDSAFIQFKADESHSGATALVIRGQAADNAAAFASGTRNVSSRPRTADSVAWTPPAWITGAAGAAQRTPNLASIVQSIVNRPAWASGNALAFIATGTGRRCAKTFEGEAGGAAQLTVVLGTGPPVNRAPLVEAGANRVVNYPTTVSLDGTISDDGLPAPSSLTRRWTKGSGPTGGDVAFANDQAEDTQAGFTAAGIYVLRLMADDGELSTTDSVTIELRVPGSTPVTVERRLAAGSDDAEESASGSVSVTDSDLELVQDANLQVVGLRFASLAIPPGARVDSAFIQFRADESHSGATALVFRGQAADNAAAFTSTARGVSSRPRTSDSVTWSPPAWTTGAVGVAQRTPNLASIVQGIVTRQGWASGNALAFVVTGTGRRCAETFEGLASAAPLLTVTLGVGPPVNRAPLVDAGPSQVALYPTTVTLDGSAADDGQPAPPALTRRWTLGTGPAGAGVSFADDQAEDTQASFTAAGTYVLRFTASDGELSTTDSVTIELRVPGTTQVTVERRVSAGSDDAEEKPSGSMSLTSSDLELVADGSSIQAVGMRFTGLSIPYGARVTSAWIQFEVDQASSAATSLTIRGQASVNAATFTSTSRNIVGRPLTSNTVSWTPPGWPTTSQIGPDQRTPELRAVIEELTHLSGWSTSSPIVIVITGSGQRVARAFEGKAAGAALLHVEYTY